MTANAGRADLDQLIRISHVPADEPTFYLRARDPAAFDGIVAYAAKARKLGVPIAVVEQSLMRSDAFAAFGPKVLPDAEHLTDAERKQLEYQHSRRAWRARTDWPPAETLTVALAERRGWDAAMAAVRMKEGSACTAS
jgi:hypothetical protein